MIVLFLALLSTPSDDATRLRQLCDGYFDHLAQHVTWLREDAVMDRVPDMSLAFARKEAAHARQLLAELATLDEAHLSLDEPWR